MTATFAPSGRPLVARSSGTVAINSKLSGVPDLLLTLSTPGGGYGRKASGLDFPVFHPCVRLARWKERPGELSFVPPDGKFILASYEVDLLSSHNFTTATKSNLQLPVTVEIKKSLGELGNEFEVRVTLNHSVATPHTATTPTSPFPRGIGSSGPVGRGSSPAFGGSSNNPVLEDVMVTIPLSNGIKTLVTTKASRGEWHHEKGKILWKIPASNGGALGMPATFRTGIILKSPAEDDEDDEDSSDSEAESVTGEYDDGSKPPPAVRVPSKKKEEALEARLLRRKMKVATMMPRTVLAGFSVKGWLASGVKVDGLQVVHAKGVGEGVKPYKGVKYLTKASGMEFRC